MTYQSSFLIRCWLQSEAGATTVKTYQVQHVQTGEEFRSPDWNAVTAWIENENRAYGLRVEGDALGGAQ